MTTGVLLMNTGTPDAPTVDAIKPYLTEFLMDPFIIGAPYFIRKPLVAHIVRNRPQRTVGLYQTFWTSQGSPFMITSRRQCQLLQKALNANERARANSNSNTNSTGKRAYRTTASSLDAAFANTASETSLAQPAFRVELAMRYGNPSIAHGLEQLRAARCNRIVLLPLYPQNVEVCAGTCFAQAHRQLKALNRAAQRKHQAKWNPEIIEIASFHQVSAYRHALANQVAAHWRYKPGSKLVVSFHSTLLSHIKKDPTYLNQCKQTAAWLAEDLNINTKDVLLTFQSRFDSRAWLSPFTESTVQRLVDQGIQDICVVCPGFVAENIETSIEISQDLREQVEQRPVIGHVAHTRLHVLQDAAAHASFTYVPALGESPQLIEALTQAIDLELSRQAHL